MSFSFCLLNGSQVLQKKLLPELKVGGIENNSKIIFPFFNENLCCDPSLEPSL